MRVSKIGGMTVITGEGPEDMAMALALVLAGIDAAPIDLAQFFDAPTTESDKQSATFSGVLPDFDYSGMAADNDCSVIEHDGTRLTIQGEPGAIGAFADDIGWQPQG